MQVGSNLALTNTVVALKPQIANQPAGGGLYFLGVYNPNASVAFIQLFNAIVANVTLGTTTPTLSLGVPASVYTPLIQIPIELQFPTGICFAATTTANGNTALGSALVVGYGFD